MRPELSVTGTRCTRWVPPSNFRWLHAFVALDHEDDLVEAAEVGDVGRQDLHRPADAGGVGLVHLEQVPGEEVRLLAPLGASDLDDHVPAIIGIGGDQQDLQLLLQLGQLILGGMHLLPRQGPLVTAGLGQELPGRFQVGLAGQVAAVGLDDGREVLVALRGGPQPGLVAEHRRVGQLRPRRPRTRRRDLPGAPARRQARSSVVRAARSPDGTVTAHGHAVGTATTTAGAANRPARRRVTG